MSIKAPTVDMVLSNKEYLIQERIDKVARILGEEMGYEYETIYVKSKHLGPDEIAREVVKAYKAAGWNVEEPSMGGYAFSKRDDDED